MDSPPRELGSMRVFVRSTMWFLLVRVSHDHSDIYFFFFFNPQVSPGWTEESSPFYSSSVSSWGDDTHQLWRYASCLSSPPDFFNRFAQLIIHLIVVPGSFSSCYLSSWESQMPSHYGWAALYEFFFFSAHSVSSSLQEMSCDFNTLPSWIGTGEKLLKGAFICPQSAQTFQCGAQQSKVQSDPSCEIKPRKCNCVWMIFAVQKVSWIWFFVSFGSQNFLISSKCISLNVTFTVNFELNGSLLSSTTSTKQITSFFPAH